MAEEEKSPPFGSNSSHFPAVAPSAIPSLSPLAAALDSLAPFGASEGGSPLEDPGNVSPFRGSSGGASPFGTSEGGSPFGDSSGNSPFLVTGNPFASDGSTESTENPFSGGDAAKSPIGASVEGISPVNMWSPSTSSPATAAGSSSTSMTPTSPFASVPQFGGSSPSTMTLSSKFGGVKKPAPLASAPVFNFGEAPVNPNLGDEEVDEDTVEQEFLSNRKQKMLKDGQGTNPFQEMSHRFQTDCASFSLPERVLMAAKALGPDVRSKAEQLEVTDTLGRVRICLENVKERTCRFPPVVGRVLLTACLEEEDEHGCDMALELMEFMTADSLLYTSVGELGLCPLCHYRSRTKRKYSELDADRRVDKTYWAHLHKIHGKSKEETEKEEKQDEGKELAAEKEAKARREREQFEEMEDSPHTRDDGFPPFISACAKPLFAPLAIRMSQLLEEEKIPPLVLSPSIGGKTCSCALMGQWIAALGSPAAIEGILACNVERLIGCLAAELPVTGPKEGRELLWKGKALCFEIAGRLLETTVLADRRTKLMAAMAQAIFDGLRESDGTSGLVHLTPLLQKTPVALKEWMGEVHIITPFMAPFRTDSYQQLCCPLVRVIEQATSLQLLSSLDLLLNVFKDQFVSLREEIVTRLLFSAAEYGGPAAVQIPMQHLPAVSLLRKVGNITVAEKLLQGNCILDPSVREISPLTWLQEIIEDLYKNSTDQALAFLEETTYTPLEVVLPGLFSSNFKSTGAWLMDLLAALEEKGLDDVVDLEMGHCYAILSTRNRSVLDEFFRPEAGTLMTSRVVIDMMKHSVGYLEENLIPVVAPAVYCKIDNEDRLTPLAAYAQRSDEERTMLIFNACPSAMCVEMPKVGSALHCIISVNRLSLEFLLHILDTLEERDFFFYEDQYGNNTLHVAALSTADRSVIEVLRSTMPSSVASAVNKAGLSPLELYRQFGLAKHAGQGDLTELFLANSMAKRAF